MKENSPHSKVGGVGVDFKREGKVRKSEAWCMKRLSPSEVPQSRVEHTHKLAQDKVKERRGGLTQVIFTSCETEQEWSSLLSELYIY